VAHAIVIGPSIVIGPFELAAPGPGSSKARKTRARSLGCDSLSAQAHLLPNLLPIRLVLVACDPAENALFGPLGLERSSPPAQCVRPRQLVGEAAERRLATARRGRP
jgi:hypothetical protein